MADIKIAIMKTINNEGGYVDNPVDSGGPTRYGITQKDLPGADIKTLDIQTAISYYLEHYVKPLYAQINNQEVLEKLFDMGVLFGVGTATKALQRALGQPENAVDGQFGPITLAMVNNASVNFEHVYVSELASHAAQVVKANPQDIVFLKGWLRRIGS